MQTNNNKIINWSLYNQYLKSKCWSKKAERNKKLAGYKCDKCGSTKLLKTHHKTYDNIFREDQSDLECLCNMCHYKLHAEIRNKIQYENESIDYNNYIIDYNIHFNKNIKPIMNKFNIDECDANAVYRDERW